MSREIKFRAWDKEYKILTPVIRLDFNSDFPVMVKGTSLSYMDTLMQYTGLKDKTGKEIYEGDIVSWSAWKKGSIEARTYNKRDDYVYWDEQRGSWKIGQLGEEEHSSLELGIYDDIEVIGNIYENKEVK